MILLFNTDLGPSFPSYLWFSPSAQSHDLSFEESDQLFESFELHPIVLNRSANE